MADNKKKPSKGLTDAEKAKAKAKLQKQKAKAAKKREKQKAKAEKDAIRYEKAAAAERQRAAEELKKQKEQEKDPAYQAKKAKEAEKLKAKGKREVEKNRKKSARKADAAAKSKEKNAAKREKAAMKPSRKASRNTGRRNEAGSARGERKASRRKSNIIALVVIAIIAIASAIILYPPTTSIQQGLDIQGGVSLDISATEADGSAPTDDEMDEASKVITSRVNASGASAASVQQEGSSSFLVQVPGADNSQSIIERLSGQGVLEFVRVDAIDDDDVVSSIENNITGMNLNDLYGDGETKVDYEPFMTGDEVNQATVKQSETGSDFEVDLDLNSTGTSEFSDVTSELVSTNGQIAIVLDGVVECAPAVQAAITNGQVSITGNYTSEEANDLKAIIDSGSLPVSLTIDQSSVVGPTLGQSALKVGIISALIGLILVIVWMLICYGGLGLFTGLSIVVMAILYLGLLALLSKMGWFSLTLPGIAGIIVNIGLSADSSILIMECFQEQVRKGRSVKAAAVSGVHEGIWTSIDADIVTLVSALVLYFVAMGDVRGFGLTLALGIICDLVVMFLFSGPLVRLLGERTIAAHPGFWGMRDEINEGEYVTKEVR